MTPFLEALPYIIVMAIVTYLIRMIPLVFIRKKITNVYVLSFLYYVPYAVLSAMTFPATLFGTGNIVSAIIGLLVGLIMAYFEKSLITVALSACGGALITELIISALIK